MRYLLIIAVIFMACEGPVGPVGVQGAAGADGINGADGEQGIQGEPGPGTRTILTGTVIDNSDFVDIPGLNPDDPPSIDVYICPTNSECLPLPITLFTNDLGDFTTTHLLAANGIFIINAASLILARGGTSGTYVIVMVE